MQSTLVGVISENRLLMQVTNDDDHVQHLQPDPMLLLMDTMFSISSQVQVADDDGESAVQSVGGRNLVARGHSQHPPAGTFRLYVQIPH